MESDSNRRTSSHSYTGNQPLEANFVHYTVDSKLEVYNGVGWDEVVLDPNALYNDVGIFKAPSADPNTDPQAQWDPGVWGVSGIGEGVGATFGQPGVYRRELSPALTLGRVTNTAAIISSAGGFSSWSIRNVAAYQDAVAIIPATLDGNWFIPEYPQVFDIGYREEPLVAGDSYCNIDISGQGAVPVGSLADPNPWSIKLRAAKYSLHPTMPPSDTMYVRITVDNDPPIDDPEYNGNQVIESNVANARWGSIVTFNIQSFRIIEVTPAIPPDPGTDPSPAVPHSAERPARPPAPTPPLSPASPASPPSQQYTKVPCMAGQRFPPLVSGRNVSG